MTQDNKLITSTPLALPSSHGSRGLIKEGSNREQESPHSENETTLMSNTEAFEQVTSTQADVLVQDPTFTALQNEIAQLRSQLAHAQGPKGQLTLRGSSQRPRQILSR